MSLLGLAYRTSGPQECTFAKPSLCCSELNYAPHLSAVELKAGIETGKVCFLVCLPGVVLPPTRFLGGAGVVCCYNRFP